MNKKNFLLVILEIFLIILLPMVFILGVSQQQPLVRKAAEGGIIPTATPIPDPSSGMSKLNFMVRFEGLLGNFHPDLLVTLKVKEANFTKSAVISANDGNIKEISLTGLALGETSRNFELILSAPGFLAVKKTYPLAIGRNPPIGGYFDFGTFRIGDLNGDNQINGLDWSLMKQSFGESGEY